MEFATHVLYTMGGNIFRDLLDVADIIILARGNQHPPVHHDGLSGHETWFSLGFRALTNHGG
jgi:hypothetical protein